MPNVAATLSLNVPAITALCKGDPGTSILHGLFAPTLAVGNLGDFYLDTYAYVLYGPKSDQDWGVATILSNSISAGIWNDSYTYLYSNTAVITSSTSTLSSLSSEWSSVYNNVYSMSSNWTNGNPAFNVISPLSANLISLYTTVTSYSASWSAGGTYASANPNDWNSTHDTVFKLSGSWGLTPTVVSLINTVTSTSGNWSSVYNQIYQLSGGWDNTIKQVNNYLPVWNQTALSMSTDIVTNSGNWQSNYIQTTTLSGTWGSVFTTVCANSAAWGNANSSLSNIMRTNSGHWINSYKSMDTDVSPNTADWMNVYSWVYGVSTYWNDAADIVNGSPAGGWAAWDNAWTALTYIQPVFNTISATFVSMSATWNSTYNSMTALSGTVKALENAAVYSTDPWMGLSAMSSGTVTVANKNVAANSRIFLTIQDPNGTASPGNVWVQSRSAGTNFVIKSSNASDTSKVAWLIAVPL